MNTEIKFRAWDKDDKVIVPVTKLEYKNGEIIKIGVLFKGHKVESLRYPSSVELMQYTGLKDEAGIEIYRGNIIKCINTKEYNGTVENLEVCFSDDYAFAVSACLPLTWGGFKSIEVIGNIYENKDLLTNK